MNLIRKQGLLWLLILTVLLAAGCGRPNETEAMPADEQAETLNGSNDPLGSGDPTESEPVDVQYYVLYLKHRDQAFIFSDTHSIRTDDPALADRTLAEYVVEQLIQQRGVGELINPIHPETTLLSLEQDGRKTIVNLSRSFAQGMTGTPEDTEAIIAMVVNSLITLPGIDQVTLLIEGEIPDTINGLVIKDVYEFITDYYPDK